MSNVNRGDQTAKVLNLCIMVAATLCHTRDHK